MGIRFFRFNFSMSILLLFMASCSEKENGEPSLELGDESLEGPWVKTFGGSSVDVGSVVATDSNGNYIIVGRFSSTIELGGKALTNAGGRDLFLAKLSPGGIVQWARSIGGGGDEYVNAIVLDANNNIFLGGMFTGSGNLGGGARMSAGGYDAFLAKYSAEGAYVWSKNFGSVLDDMIASIDLDLPQENIVVTGNFTGTVDFGGTILNSASVGTDTFLAKYSTTDGSHIFSKSFLNASYDSGVKVFVDKSDTSNNILLVGTFSWSINLGGGMMNYGGSNGGSNFYIGKFSSSGSHLWSEHYGGTNGVNVYAAALDTHGGLVLTGTFGRQTDLGGGVVLGTALDVDIFLAKYSAADGSFVWGIPLNCSNGGKPTSLEFDSQDNPLVTGHYYGICNFGAQSLSSVGGSADVFLAKYSGTGVAISAESFGGLGTESCSGIIVDRDNSTVLVGGFTGNADFGGETFSSADSIDAFVIKLDP